MLIHRGGTEGTIGGGALEHVVIRTARKMLTTGDGLQRVDHALGPEIDQCCGGRVVVVLRRFESSDLAGHNADSISLAQDAPDLIEEPTWRQVIVYGAGHVGRALASALDPLPFALTLTDSRTEMDAQDVVLSPLPEKLAEAAEQDAFHLVMTHSHALDLEITSAVLSQPHGFCGLIGSATKLALFQRRLIERGLTSAQIAALVCPIGDPGLRDKRPAVIAASTVMQLLHRDAELREAATADVSKGSVCDG